MTKSKSRFFVVVKVGRCIMFLTPEGIETLILALSSIDTESFYLDFSAGERIYLGIL